MNAQHSLKSGTTRNCVCVVVVICINNTTGIIYIYMIHIHRCTSRENIHLLISEKNEDTDETRGNGLMHAQTERA